MVDLTGFRITQEINLMAFRKDIPTVDLGLRLNKKTAFFPFCFLLADLA